MRPARAPAVAACLAGTSLVALAFPAHAQEPEPPRTSLHHEIPLALEECSEVRRFDPASYWFWEGYFGVSDTEEVEGELQGRLVVQPGICFRADASSLDSDEARTRGYREAVDELLKWVDEEARVAPAIRRARGRVDEDTRTTDMALRHLERLTGHRPDLDEAWAGWWDAHRAYMWWSDEVRRLEVVEDARAAAAPLDDDALVLEAGEYWFYDGRGWISSREQRGRYVLGTVQIPPHAYPFRTLAGDVDDRDAKQQGYRRALENLVVDGLQRDGLHARDLQALMERASRLTGLSFQERVEWVQWWQESRDRLVLSADGSRLVVGSGPRR